MVAPSFFTGQAVPLSAHQKKAHKFRAQRVQVNGIHFDSKGESECYQELCFLEAKEIISNLRLKPTFEFFIGHHCIERWKIDYTYQENGKHVAEDFTGCMTRRKKKLMKLFQEQYPDWELRITGK